MLYANEHVAKARSHKTHAEHQMQDANEVVDATDIAALNNSERQLWGQVKTGKVLLYQAISSHEITLGKHQEGLLRTAAPNRR